MESLIPNNVTNTESLKLQHKMSHHAKSNKCKIQFSLFGIAAFASRKHKQKKIHVKYFLKNSAYKWACNIMCQDFSMSLTNRSSG